MPRIHAVQPAGCLTVVASYERGDDEIRTVNSTTRVSGLSVPTDIDASRALALLKATGGWGIAVTDDEVYAAQRLLMEREGIYAEPAGATALAGWRRAQQEGRIREGERSVCLVTGHGFKDPASVQEAANRHPDLTLPAGELPEALRRIVEGAC